MKLSEMTEVRKQVEAGNTVCIVVDNIYITLGSAAELDALIEKHKDEEFFTYVFWNTRGFRDITGNVFTHNLGPK